MSYQIFQYTYGTIQRTFSPLNAQLNPICHMLALFGAHSILHVSRIRVKASISRLLPRCPRPCPCALLQRESHKTDVPPTSVTWLQLLRKQTISSTCIAVIVETHWFTRTQFAHSPDLWYQPRLANVTCACSWRLCGNNPHIIRNRHCNHVRQWRY
jgi:hypothetical protein